ncbi:MAG: hypothetical protein HQ583_10670 [Candidatus Abyssubacteria bacterium]|nr:hypothetical protein [Candidatus Abyssubacteria bacterium]
MTTFVGGKRFVYLAVVGIAAVSLASTLGCSADARARRGLKNIVYEQIKQFNKYHLREIKPTVYQSKGKQRFYRTYKERVDHVQNMRRTNSIDTPFIATLRFTENTYLTQRRDTADEAGRDSHFILSTSRKREIVYAFVGDMWKKKEIY